MSNKMKFAKIRQENGQYSQTIPIGVDAQNVDLADGRTLAQVVDNLLEYDDFAEPFTQSKVYNIGDYVFYNDNLYRFKSKHNANVAWSNTLVDEVILTDELSKVIQIKTEQPTEGANKIWINPNGSDNIEIITYDEFKNFEYATIAEEFNTAKAYSIGDYVIFEDRIYRFISNHATNQRWDQTQVQQVKLGNELKRVETVQGDCVRYDIEQMKTETEKLQARNNEGAAGITSLAPTYSATSTYEIGDIVTQNGKMYKCTATIENVEPWTIGHWVEINTGNEISDLKNSLNQQVDNLKEDSSNIFKNIYSVTYSIETGELITNGQLNPITGTNMANSAKTTRTNYFVVNAPVLFYMTNLDYEYTIWTYLSNATSNAVESQTNRKYTSYPTIIRPAEGEHKCRIGFRRKDGADLTTSIDDSSSDFYKIMNSVAYLLLTDDTLSKKYISADSFSIGDKAILSRNLTISSSNVLSYPSVDNFPVNEIVTVLTSAITSGLANFPLSYGGTVLTFASKGHSATGNDAIIQIVVPFAAANGLIMIRTKSSGAWTKWRYTSGELTPTGDQADRANDIYQYLNTRKTIKLSSGDYYCSGIVMPNDTEIIGSGPSTRLILTQNATARLIKMGVNCKISNLTLCGSESSITINENVTNRNAIEVIGSGIDDTIKYKERIDNVEIYNFTGSGIYLTSTGQGVATGTFIEQCNIHDCNVGINIPYVSEFNRIINTRVNNCYYGIINNGGNNYFLNCGLDENYVCLKMYAENINNESSAPNNSHGSFIGCSFHHSDNIAGSGNGIAITINNMISTEMFIGCLIGTGKININNSNGITFSACSFFKNSYLNVSGTGSTLLIGCILGNLASNPTVTKTGDGTLHIINCYNRSGAIRTDFP